MTQRPDWVSWGEYQVAVCGRCNGTYDLQTLPSGERQDALAAFVTSHTYCRKDVGRQSANTITIRQQTALTIYTTLLVHNADGVSQKTLAQDAVAAARVFCETLSE